VFGKVWNLKALAERATVEKYHKQLNLLQRKTTVKCESMVNPYAVNGSGINLQLQLNATVLVTLSLNNFCFGHK